MMDRLESRLSQREAQLRAVVDQDHPFRFYVAMILIPLPMVLLALLGEAWIFGEGFFLFALWCSWPVVWMMLLVAFTSIRSPRRAANMAWFLLFLWWALYSVLIFPTLLGNNIRTVSGQFQLIGFYDLLLFPFFYLLPTNYVFWLSRNDPEIGPMTWYRNHSYSRWAFWGTGLSGVGILVAWVAQLTSLV